MEAPDDVLGCQDRIVGDLSPHLSRSEFMCPCGCGLDTVDSALVTKLEALREALGGNPLWISRGGGTRCKPYNVTIGGAEHSQHLLSKAADIEVDGVPPERVQEAARELGFGGVGSYVHFTHVDVRDGVSRWTI